MQIETDYLVIGSGASAMSFVDVMLQETDATFAMVDRRPAPGGHWNDAYPFVRLHQPSSFYGVASRPLGRDRKNEAGLNKGFYELASGVEITSYYHGLMDDVFLPSGRVSFHPLCEYAADGEFVSRLSGERHEVNIRKKLVDATRMTTSIPLTHNRKFEVAEGLVCTPPNDLPRLAAEYRSICVLGGGKTAIDSIVWLLSNGYPPDAITWVMPRDAWMLNRAHFQPGIEFFEGSIGGLATQYEILATSRNTDDICRRMEQAGIWLRLDPSVTPTMFHAATVSETELEQMRRISNVLRLGHVQRIEPDKIILEQGEAAGQSNTLYIDCTASAVADNVGDPTPVFSPGKIALQMIRPFQPCFSSAVIAHIEATIQDDAIKKSLTMPTPMVDTVEDWLSVQAAGMINQYQWSQNQELSSWIAACRLDGFGKTISMVTPDDTQRMAVLERMLRHGPAAVQNLQRIAQQAGSQT